MKILALSKTVFDKYMQEKAVTIDNIEQIDKVLFISINEEYVYTNEDVPYFTQDRKNLMVLYFSDVEIIINDKEKTYHPFSKEQASNLYNFIKQNIKGKDVVLIHCTAGVSRSGAVASFIHDFVSGNWEQFKRDNPFIVPNAHVYRLLHDEWYKDLEFPKNWTEEYEKEFQVKVMNPTSPELHAAMQNESSVGYSHTSIEYLTEKEVVERWGKRILEKNKKYLHKQSEKEFQEFLIKDRSYVRVY